MKEPAWRTALKYLMHGTLFLIIYFAMLFGWAFLLVALVAIGLFLGLVVGLIALFFIIGALNSFLADVIWGMSMKTSWKSLLGHGTILFIVLLVVNVPHVIVNLLVQNWGIFVIGLVIYAFVDGFVAKKVANSWEKQGGEGERVGTTPKAFLKTCIKCGQQIPLASEMCPYCGSEQT